MLSFKKLSRMLAPFDVSIAMFFALTGRFFVSKSDFDKEKGCGAICLVLASAAVFL
jgi:hypothetical protein